MDQQPGIHGEEAPDGRAAGPGDDPTEPIDGLAAIDEPIPSAAPAQSAASAQPAAPAAPTAPAETPPGIDEPTLELPVVTPRTAGARRVAVAAGAAVLLLVAVLIVRSGTGPARPAAGPGRTPTPGGTWGMPSGAALPGTATFDVADGVSRIVLRTAALGGDLYRVDAPGAEPRITRQDDTIRLDVATAAEPVRIALAEGVRWDLRIGGGVELSTIDLSGARLNTVDLTGGADRIDLTLPEPDGTLTVRMTGGVSRFDVHTALHVPVRVRVGSGAARVVLDGLRHDGVPAGALFTPDHWAAAVNRVDVDAVAGMSDLTVAAF